MRPMVNTCPFVRGECSRKKSATACPLDLGRHRVTDHVDAKVQHPRPREAPLDLGREGLQVLLADGPDDPLDGAVGSGHELRREVEERVRELRVGGTSLGDLAGDECEEPAAHGVVIMVTTLLEALQGLAERVGPAQLGRQHRPTAPAILDNGEDDQPGQGWIRGTGPGPFQELLELCVHQRGCVWRGGTGMLGVADDLRVAEGGRAAP